MINVYIQTLHVKCNQKHNPNHFPPHKEYRQYMFLKQVQLHGKGKNRMNLLEPTKLINELSFKIFPWFGLTHPSKILTRLKKDEEEK